MKAPSKTQPHAHPDHRSISETDAAEITARILLETESVLFRPDDPFTFTSGRKSPVYIDCRRLISFPRARTKLMDLAAEGITLLALATWWDVAQTAERLGRFAPGQYDAVRSFLEDPEAWSKARATARR